MSRKLYSRDFLFGCKVVICDDGVQACKLERIVLHGGPEIPRAGEGDYLYFRFELGLPNPAGEGGVVEEGYGGERSYLGGRGRFNGRITGFWVG